MTKIMTLLIAALIIGIICFITAIIMIGRRSTLRNLHPGKRYTLLLIVGIITIIPGIALPIVSGAALVIVGTASKCIDAVSGYKENHSIIENRDEDMSGQQVRFVDKNGNERTYTVQYAPDGTPHFVEKPDAPDITGQGAAGAPIFPN